MFTEILGLLIIIGAIFILFLKSRTESVLPKPRRYERQQVSSAGEELQAQLERTGNEILMKIGREIDRLEQATQEAERTIDKLKKYNAFLAEYANRDLADDSQKDFSSLLQSVEKRLEDTPPKEPSQKAHVDIVSEQPAQQKPIKPPVPQREVDVEPSDTAKQIFALLDEGLDIEEICRRMSLSKGAVEMIVNMYQQKK